MILIGNTINPSVIVIGVFHGDEPQGEILINNYFKITKNTNLLMIPRLNACNKRTNQNGVDLNRNFPTKNWELTIKNEYFGGLTPASEKETQFIIDTIKKFNPKIILTLHAPYKIVNYDGPYHPIIKDIAEILKYPIETSIGYPTPGSFGTWAGIENNITTITLELDENSKIEELQPKMNKIFKLLERI